MPQFLRRPLPLALLIAGLAELLFAWRVTIPSKPYFDEVHYVPAARTLLALAHPANIEHPLLAKELIALGIWLFGDDPLGWRMLSTLAGSAVVAGVFALVWLGTRRLRPALVASVLTLVNFTVFVQARIAMLDGFMAAFVILGAASLLWSMHGAPGQVRRRWGLGAVLLGLATACKWTAAPYVTFAALAYLLLRRGRPDRWPGLGPVMALALLGGVSVATYFLTFAPAFFYAQEPLTLATLLPFQWTMFQQQTQVLPAHTYQSAWYTWQFDWRPIWYLYEPVDGAQRGVLLLGNPAVMWGGLVAVLACAGAWLRTRAIRPGAAAGLWIASIAIWPLIPKSLGFFYYYYLPSIWLAVVLAVALDHWRARLRYWDEVVVMLAVGLFLHFYPILSAAPLAGPGAFARWIWLDSWA
ncbi:dolichyl-phosphate-mannose-protein mannosyltransferase [Sphingomonas sp. SORGH_AS802]|uniref:phospholipid carrier-dependent glycosyltransferase n=1 Tax=unclassified Sphingomonas TaxID=196159 RepID=UPI00285A423B|nr:MULTISPECIES: phospholipid carrier-dependent glycosyltransferase [unclassified Sphingomonas]MDR6125527.1 dolichyl-phosphate-mannose-protein mannosyltransferase [Sphingomonas sp. SORGH_AS_0438]MDR6134142.1 dolichyl-phosphate-mannose-protein mannosyltransferase [Sphingomonas sp. SORGH_AS_0802]